MLGVRELRDRVELLEYENRILEYKINEILKQLKAIKPMAPMRETRDGTGKRGGYYVLRDKYRG
jgi:hypothetical protein